MSIEFFEGFETVGTELGLANQATTRPRIELRWDATVSGGIPSSDSFFLIDDDFSEGYAINMGTNGAFSSGNRLVWIVPASLQEGPSASFTPWIIGFRLHIPSGSHNWTPLYIRGLFGGSNQTGTFQLQIENSSNLNVFRDNPGGTEVGNADGVLHTDTWHYIEVEFKIAESAGGGYVEVRLDDNTVISETGIDLNPALSTGFERVYFQNSGGLTGGTDFVGFDDIYIVNTGSTPHDDFFGPARVFSLPPNADDLAQWDNEPSTGDNYSKVDENGGDDTDYVETDVPDNRDRYEITNPSQEGEVLAVKLEARAINPTGESPSLFLEVTSGTSVESTEHSVTSTTAYEVFDMLVQDDPAGGAWTITSINNLQAGYRFVN